MNTPTSQLSLFPLPLTYIKGRTLIHIESSIDATPAGEPICSLPLRYEARAALIVRAVNSHAALLEALKADEDALCLSDQQFYAKHGYNVCETANRRRAAIAKAEGRT